jgi:uncharacterized protein (TIGR03067 family)
MRCLSLLSTALLMLPLLGSDSPKEYDDKMESVGIEGTWRLIEIELSGVKATPTQVVQTYCRRTYTSTINGTTSGGDYRIDSTCHPHHLDEIASTGPSKGETFKYIYQFDGDTLKIAYLPFGNPRPQGFNDKHIAVWTYKRVK